MPGQPDGSRPVEPAGALEFGSPTLQAPVLSLGESGAWVPLPETMPERARRPLRVTTLSGAAVLVPPRSARAYVLDASGGIWMPAMEPAHGVHERARRDLRAAAGADTRHDGRAVGLVSGQRGGYWHWWVDAISRIWLLERIGAGSLPLAFAPLQPGFQREAVELLGLEDRLVALEAGVTRFPSVTTASGVAPGASRFASPHLASFGRWLRERLAPADPGPSRRLFVTRADARTRRVVNEAELVGLLQGRGFEFIECGRLGLAGQIGAFAAAELVVGPHGAGLTNLLFAGRGTRVLELFAAPAALGASNYRVIASHLGQPYARVLGRPAGTGRTPHDLDLHVDLAAVEQALDALERA